MNDPALIAALLDRNPGAGRSFIERHDAFLRRVVLSASPAARGLVDDLTHDVYVHLWRDDFRVLRQWQRERPLRAYLHTVITRLVWDRLSSLQPAWEQLDDDPWTAAGAQRWASDQPPTPEEEVAAKEVTRIVRNALDGLDGSSSQVVELRYFRELSYGEIADLVGITRSNVGVRLNRALSRLKEALTKALMPRTVLP